MTRPLLPLLLLWLCLQIVMSGAAGAADRDRIRAFLNVTGFDVALDSIALSAGSAPAMLGLDAEDFGESWERVTAEVFDTSTMRALALDILEETLTDDLLNHAAAFYASDLGQRLVEAENASHMIEDDAGKQEQGKRIIADLVAEGSPRAQMLQRMNGAIDSSGTSVRALQEIQFRFLLAASAAGVVDLKMDPDELRAMFKSQEREMRRLIQMSSMASAAYTYRDFSDADVQAYTEALEEPEMKRVYELLNAVQYEVMANRFEVLAARMAELHPGQDI
ncbi:DUF2059 domain-containing protein [Sedimentitalea sp. CAU 1593]|uniref:DUF2059 domain-containing protein n=2 Tax=Sedimentitalea arenosa TaxID=2798803 RepID=A0A8J7JGS6_9RHOB|nr:DUF2059 domain-containing protein [Arenibacterium arenosum]